MIGAFIVIVNGMIVNIARPKMPFHPHQLPGQAAVSPARSASPALERSDDSA
jgi:hypothetical protein